MGKEKNIKLAVYCLSLLFVAICFGGSVWLSVVLGDMMSYAMAALFGLGMIWFGINVINIYKEKQ